MCITVINRKAFFFVSILTLSVEFANDGIDEGVLWGNVAPTDRHVEIESKSRHQHVVFYMFEPCRQQIHADNAGSIPWAEGIISDNPTLPGPYEVLTRFTACNTRAVKRPNTKCHSSCAARGMLFALCSTGTRARAGWPIGRAPPFDSGCMFGSKPMSTRAEQ